MTAYARALLLAGALLTAIALSAAPALAERGHVPGVSFGGLCTSEPCEGKFKEPVGAAVNEATGDVYVLDRGGDRVVRVSSKGVFESEFDGSGALPGEGKAAGGGGVPGEVETGRFEGPEGLAVDNSCFRHELTEASKPKTCKEFDPSNGDVYVADVTGNGQAGHRVIDKYTAAGEYVGQVIIIAAPPAAHVNELFGVDVDSNGRLWIYQNSPTFLGRVVADFTNAVANKFLTSSRNLSEPGILIGFPAFGLAVDASGALYLGEDVPGAGGQCKVLGKFTGVGEPLVYQVVDECSSGVATEAPGNDVYVDVVSGVVRLEADGGLVERLPVPGGGGAGVGVDSASETLFVPESVSGLVDVFVPEPPGVPTVTAGSEGVSGVVAESARFTAEVNPRSEAGEPATKYRFEYGPCPSLAECPSAPFPLSVPVPDGLLAANYEPDTVSAHVAGLTPGTTYHFRVVAENSHPGVAEGEVLTFTTQPVGLFALPDARRWELVSPPDKHGGRLEPIFPEGGVIQAAAAGGGVTYVASAPTEAQPDGYSNDVQVLSTRGLGGSWSSRDLAAPHEAATGKSVGNGFEYRFFSSDLSEGVLQPLGVFTPSISAEASEQTPFVRSTGCVPAADAHCYRPLVTGAEGFSNVPEGTQFGGGSECLACGPQFEGATADMSHVVLRSGAPLSEGAPSGGLYEWTAGKLTLLGAVPHSGEGLGSENKSAKNAISEDGSRVIFDGSSEGVEGLLMRDTVTSTTLKLDEVQDGSGVGQRAPRFQAASNDDSEVFFTDTQRLTADSGAQSDKPDLYVCDIATGPGGLACTLTDLTPLAAGEESANVQGNVLGASEDGSWVYFAANGLQGENPGAAHGTCGTGAPGELCNVYFAHREGEVWGKPSLVAVLSGADLPDWAGDLGRQTARVSPDGGRLSFMSQRSLTGYDNRDALSGKPDEEVFSYHATDGRLVCASCDPTGSRPVGKEVAHTATLAETTSVWPAGTWIAGNVPGWTAYQVLSALYQSRYLTDAGRLFFNSSDALAPQDVNGVGDVYEYEPPGVGDCTTASVTFSERSGGCVNLISSGTSSEESGFLDASETGSDVFFLTSARLSKRDVDTSVDVYDAHECTPASPCGSEPEAPLPCTTESSCKPSPAPQPSIFGAPASATFTGLGNPLTTETPPPPKHRTPAQDRAEKLKKALKACKKDKKKPKRARCERAARAKYGVNASKTAKRNR